MQGKPDARQQLERVAKDHPKEADVVRDANERLELASLPPSPPKAQAEKPQGKKQK